MSHQSISCGCDPGLGVLCPMHASQRLTPYAALRPSATDPAEAPLSEREREIRWKWAEHREAVTNDERVFTRATWNDVSWLLAELDALRARNRQLQSLVECAKQDGELLDAIQDSGRTVREELDALREQLERWDCGRGEYRDHCKSDAPPCISCSWKARTEALQGQLTTTHGAMTAQDERERLAGDKCGVSALAHGCDWPDAVAEAVIVLRGQLTTAEQERDDWKAQFDLVKENGRYCWKQRAEVAEAKLLDAEQALAQEREIAEADPAEQRAERYALEAADLAKRLHDAEQEIAHLKDTRQQAPSPEYLMACLTVERDALKAKLHDAEQQIAKLRSRELDNHHNAIMCPYCNPRGLALAPPPQETP